MVIEIRKEEKQDSNNPTFPLELKIKSQLLLIQPSKKIPRIRSNNSIMKWTHRGENNIRKSFTKKNFLAPLLIDPPHSFLIVKVHRQTPVPTPYQLLLH